MYIRTKDGVYENAHPYFTEDNKVYMRWDYPSNIEPEFLGDVIAQSENLEELCDEIVVHRKESNYNFVWNEERNIGFYYFCSFPEKYDVYGAIWTSEGLIYIAKMNENGELELI